MFPRTRTMPPPKRIAYLTASAGLDMRRSWWQCWRTASRSPAPACTRAGLLVRKWPTACNPGLTIGYVVALPGDATEDGRAAWCCDGEAQVGSGLAWPKLSRQLRPSPDITPGHEVFTPCGTGRSLASTMRVAWMPRMLIRPWLWPD